jgi:hypothetical protein
MYRRPSIRSLHADGYICAYPESSFVMMRLRSEEVAKPMDRNEWKDLNNLEKFVRVDS